MLTHCKVGAIVFFVSDLARSVDFYRGTLGLPIDALDGHDGPWAMGDVGDLTLVFIPRPARAGESPDGGLSLDFLDPDGNVLSLHQPAGAARRT